MDSNRPGAEIKASSMSSTTETPQEVLLSWYSTQSSLTVDIVGDFAGRELFLVHGESLIRHCLPQSKVDFHDGFQLLHAVYAVEEFLENLRKRGCNFDVVFFNDLKDACVPAGVREEDAYKYYLTRTILIQHLARANLDSEILEFDSFESNGFAEYLSSHAIHFVFCNEGEGDDEGPQIVQLRHLIRKFFSRGTNVAIINSTVWKSSRVFVPMLSGAREATPALEIDINQTHEDSPDDVEILCSIDDFDIDTDLSISEWVVVTVSRAILEQQLLASKEPGKEALDRVQALLLHTATLQICSLQERQCDDSSKTDGALAQGDLEFLHKFADVSKALLEKKPAALSEFLEEEPDWDLYDLIDGRVFFSLVSKIRAGEAFPEDIVKRALFLWEEVEKGQSSLSKRFNVSSKPPTSQASKSAPTSTPTAVLAFDHPVLNEYLKEIKVGQAKEPRPNPTAKMVFEDLRNLHREKPVIAWRKPDVLDKKAMKRKQRQMADIISYAASLTNSRGKVLDREAIVYDPQKKQKPNRPTQKLPQREANMKGQKKGIKKGGKGDALEAAQAIQAQKIRSKRDDVVKFWAKTCKDFEQDPSLVARYLKADRFLISRTKEDYATLEPEVGLYLCHILSNIWVQTREGVEDKSPQGLYLVAMMWRWLREISLSQTSTPAVAKAVQDITTSLRLPRLDIVVGEPPRNLPFTMDVKAASHSAKLFKDPRFLQLEYGGPYMDRHFDSKADSRVPFEPDAWQRDVLDAIDAEESVLVVAPTSAGKTFISFYAMKKVLEESDDAVLVYVAPTKALVNQIAAEVEARYSKSYHGKAGKSVWAIDSLDYRINNPTGCQVLVTVPEVLQTMLLSPKHAENANSWSRRVKRIIFDEVHCIGQAEDGVIWEQLLLLAPCPIIALSATVGNPNEFRDWLAFSQKQKGYKMTMIVWGVRYSDLRKFIYDAPQDFTFHGLQKVTRLPVPGLDEGNAISTNLRFVHPVVALQDRNRDGLDDVSLEARDCYTLWGQMSRTLPPELLNQGLTLDPAKALPEAISKQDIMEWEKNLKTTLRKTMEAPNSPFAKLQASLRTSPGEQGQQPETLTTATHTDTLFSLACDLHSQDALPAIVFNYDRHECEMAGEAILRSLEAAERSWKDSDPGWKKKVQEFEVWKKNKAGVPTRSKTAKDSADPVSKSEQLREKANMDASPWDNFDPEAPLEPYSFADFTKMTRADFHGMTRWLDPTKVPPRLVLALQRGVGVHHAGMNRKYRQIVEILFRRGYIRLVVATGTLALGVNMPCKTVIFSGDSIFLTAQNYRQASGRAGRRGFDLLGNVVFNGIPEERVHEIMSSRLPGLRGQFPISNTLMLRLLGLLHGTNNTSFAKNAVQALLSQNKLYLGGPDAEMSVKHHLRFSIEYLRRQDLVSADGTPLNFAGLIGNLYFTENSVFAFHSLLRGGYFHQLCEDIETAPEKVLPDMVLVLSHLFSRIPVRRTKRYEESVSKSSSIVFLPRLPQKAEEILVDHNEQTLSIFKGYVQSYIDQHLPKKPDNMLPFTKTAVGDQNGNQGHFLGGEPKVIRSPFVALSGLTDDFKSINELCSTVRSGVFLEESAIPYIPIWPQNTDVELNAYIYDFYKHGSLDTLVKDNRIKRSEVWFFLKDFALTLKTIVSSLQSLISGEEVADGDSDDEDDDYEELGAINGAPETATKTAPVPPAPVKAKKKAKVVDSWDDEESESEAESNWDDDDSVTDSKAQGAAGGGLLNVLKAFTKLQEEFDETFFKVWA
ncbi:Fc.00g102960.m01.CDS01 [Cosmosporella sp. VM-42]